MLLPRRAVMAVLSTALLLGLAWGCASASNGASQSRGGSGGTTGLLDSGNDDRSQFPDATGEAGGGSLDRNPLCGKPPQCLPDFVSACASYVPPTPDAGTGGASSGGSATDASAAQAGESEAGGAAGASEANIGAGGMSGAGPGGENAGGAAGEGGAKGNAGESGATGTGGVTSPPSMYGCQVQRVADTAAVVAACAAVGAGVSGSPCLSSSDCAAGLGCVGDANSGLCQRYCCGTDDTCAAGSYCTERPLRDALTNSSSTAPALSIPVCVPAQNCDLGAPYPCPKGTSCTCAEGTACLVVRANGTTTCATPGAGKVGEACPCAWGEVCSAATKKCLALCYTRGSETCADGVCQASAELPDGWGVCVGSSVPSGD